MNRFLINTDGASRGNPGHSAAAFVIKTPDGLIWAQEGFYLGITTNNEAEYRALILALTKLRDDFSKKLPAQIEVRADSLLLVKQLKQEFKIKNPNLKKLAEEVKKLAAQVGEVGFTYVPREENSLADKLANLAIDKELEK